MPQLLPYIAMSCATTEEREEIKARALAAGLSVSNYLRQLNGLDPLKRHELTVEEQRAGQAAGIVTKRLNKEDVR